MRYIVHVQVGVIIDADGPLEAGRTVEDFLDSALGELEDGERRTGMAYLSSGVEKAEDVETVR